MTLALPPTTQRRWELIYKARPWTLNQQRNMHHYAQAAKVKEWRNAFFVLAKEQQIPPLNTVCVIARHLRKTRHKVDIGAVMPATKAAIDGCLVDSGILPDDSPEYVHSLTFVAPEVVGYDALVIEIVEAA